MKNSASVKITGDWGCVVGQIGFVNVTYKKFLAVCVTTIKKAQKLKSSNKKAQLNKLNEKALKKPEKTSVKVQLNF